MKLKNKEVNGYVWFMYEKGIHSFKKELPNNKWVVIECTQKQIINGDIEFMTEHGFSISKEMKKSVQKEYVEV